MQPVNDDMDNLFRRAADNYPLNTNGANFDKVRQQVDAESSMPEQKEPKRKYFWLLLLLLVPLPFLLKHYKVDPIPQYSPSNKKYEVAEQKGKDHLSAVTRADADTNFTDEGLRTNENKKREPVNNTNSQLKLQPGNNTTVSRTDNSSIKKQHLTTKPPVNATQSYRQSTTAVTTPKNKRYSPANESVFLSSGNKMQNSKYSLLSGKDDKEKPVEELMNAKNTASVNQADIDNTDNDLSSNETQKVVSKKTADSLALSKLNKATDSADNEGAKKAVKNNNKTKSSVYIGIVIGPDYSTVKTNKSNGPGYNIGFIAGYHTGRHFSFETGVVWNYKKYHSGGKYVSPDKLALLPHTEILYLDGSCGIIEIPVSIRYHFKAIKNHNLYAGAGISSYIIKKEDYYYQYKRYNVEYYSEKEYTNSSKNWLSVLQLNIGYQLNFKKAGSLRFEPYAKLPLKGLGIGKLPISGAGINIGFTIPVH